MSGNAFLFGAVALVGVALMAPALKAPQAAGEGAQRGLPAPDDDGGAGTFPRSSPSAGNGVGSVQLERAADSHFYADAQVNGTPVRFLVDTGATSVVLTRADAQRAGLAGGEYSAWGVTPSGRVRLMPVTIARFGLGPVSTEHVSAMVAEDGMPISLLGQSYLARLRTVSIEGDRMILR
jgi:aspartyl protease family protein